METVKEDESPAALDEANPALPETTQNLLNINTSSQEPENQIVREELMKLVDVVQETYEDVVENIEKERSSQEGTHKHVHVVIQETKNEIKDLTTENKVLQRRLLALQKRRSTIGTKLFLEGAETQYQIALKAWMDAKEELDNVMNEYNNKIDRMQEIVREKQQDAGELHKAFSTYKWQLSKKNKELVELGKKTTHIVHVLSHSRERLEFVRKKIKADTGLLESLETELSIARSELQTIKIVCEKLRSKRERIQMTVNVRTLPLLDDMEAYRDEAKFLERKLKESKHQYDTLVKHIHKMQSKIRVDMPSCFIESQTLQPANNSRSLRWGASNNVHLRKAII